MKLALALDTTPNEFLLGSLQQDEESWKNVAEQLRGMTPKQLSLAKSFLEWLTVQKI